jgi:hypothetical protein
MLAVTYIPFPKEQYTRVKKVLTAISKQDTSFKFWIRKRKFHGQGPEYLALIRSYSLDQAHKRGLLVTRKYLTEIQPPLNYRALEASSLPRQVDLETRSLKALADPLSLSLLVALDSAELASVEELSKALGISVFRLKLRLRRLVEAGIVAITNRKFVVTDRGSSLLAKMGAKGGSKRTNERE